jgi:hypothetical protein
MLAVGVPAIETEYGWKDWSRCVANEHCFKATNPPDAVVGTNAGLFSGTDGQYPGGGYGSVCIVFLYQNGASWHYVNAGCAQSGGYLPGRGDRVFVSSGCANIRSAPGLSSNVLDCLTNLTVVDVDSAPVYLDGHIWWHLAGRGWMAHDFLVAPKNCSC